MDDDQFTDALLEEGPGGVAETDGVEHAVFLTNLEARSLAGFDLIQDAEVRVLQGRPHNAAEAVAVFAHHINARLETSRLGRGQQTGGAGAVLGIRRVQGIQQQQVAEMKNAGLGFSKVHILTLPQRVGAPEMEKCALAVAFLGHHIRVGSRRGPRGF